MTEQEKFIKSIQQNVNYLEKRIKFCKSHIDEFGEVIPSKSNGWVKNPCVEQMRNYMIEHRTQLVLLVRLKQHVGTPHSPLITDHVTDEIQSLIDGVDA